MSKSKSRSVVAPRDAGGRSDSSTTAHDSSTTTTMQPSLHQVPQGAVPLLGAVGVSVTQRSRTSSFPNKRHGEFQDNEDA